MALNKPGTDPESAQKRFGIILDFDRFTNQNSSSPPQLTPQSIRTPIDTIKNKTGDWEGEKLGDVGGT